MKPTEYPDIRHLTETQIRNLLTEIRNARHQGYDSIRILFAPDGKVVTIPQRHGTRMDLKPRDE